MAIELNRQERADAVASLQRYFEENLPESIGDLPAGLLLDFFLEEIAPLVYNHAVSEAQTRLAGAVADLTGDVYQNLLPTGRASTANARRGAERTAR